MVATATKLPAIRADWFVGTASRAPLYYDLLQLPQNLPELERQLRVDATADIQRQADTYTQRIKDEARAQGLMLNP
jgi:hypothetical protein